MLILSVSSLTKINTVSLHLNCRNYRSSPNTSEIKTGVYSTGFFKYSMKVKLPKYIQHRQQVLYSIDIHLLCTTLCKKKQNLLEDFRDTSSLQNWVHWDLLFLLFFIWAMISFWRAIISPDLSVNVISPSIRWLVFLLLLLSQFEQPRLRCLMSGLQMFLLICAVFLPRHLGVYQVWTSSEKHDTTGPLLHPSGKLHAAIKPDWCILWFFPQVWKGALKRCLKAKLMSPRFSPHLQQGRCASVKRILTNWWSWLITMSWIMRSWLFGPCAWQWHGGSRETISHHLLVLTFQMQYFWGCLWSCEIKMFDTWHFNV